MTLMSALGRPTRLRGVRLALQIAEYRTWIDP